MAGLAGLAQHFFLEDPNFDSFDKATGAPGIHAFSTTAQTLETLPDFGSPNGIFAEFVVGFVEGSIAGTDYAGHLIGANQAGAIQGIAAVGFGPISTEQQVGYQILHFLNLLLALPVNAC